MPLRVPVSSLHGFTHDLPCDLHLPDDSDGSLVVALHGMGQRVGSFTEDAVAVTPERAALVVPRGPYPYEKRRHGAPDAPGDAPPEMAHAWYVFTGEQAAFVKSMEKVSQWLLRLVDSQIVEAHRLGAELDSRRVAILGFSQGGYLAAFTAVRNPGWFRACVVAGGRIKDEVLADAAPRAASAGLRVLDVHGADDESVRADPCRTSAERLAALGVPVDFRTYPAGHGVLRDAQCREDVRAFLGDALRGE